MTDDGSARAKFVHNLKSASSLRLVFPRVASKIEIPNIRIRNRKSGIDFAIGSTVKHQPIVRKCTYEVKNEFPILPRRLRKNLSVRNGLKGKPKIGSVTPPVPKLNLDFPTAQDFMQEFESMNDEFSDSWSEALKEMKLSVYNYPLI